MITPTYALYAKHRPERCVFEGGHLPPQRLEAERRIASQVLPPGKLVGTGGKIFSVTQPASIVTLHPKSIGEKSNEFRLIGAKSGNIGDHQDFAAKILDTVARKARRRTMGGHRLAADITPVATLRGKQG